MSPPRKERAFFLPHEGQAPRRSEGQVIDSFSRRSKTCPLDLPASDWSTLKRFTLTADPKYKNKK